MVWVADLDPAVSGYILCRVATRGCGGPVTGLIV